MERRAAMQWQPIPLDRTTANIPMANVGKAIGKTLSSSAFLRPYLSLMYLSVSLFPTRQRPFFQFVAMAICTMHALEEATFIDLSCSFRDCEFNLINTRFLSFEKIDSRRQVVDHKRCMMAAIYIYMLVWRVFISNSGPSDMELMMLTHGRPAGLVFPLNVR
jgi:hypothetical protein